MQCSGEAAGDSVDPAGWPFLFYDPTTEPLLPQPEAAGFSPRRRAAVFVTRWLCLTGAWSLGMVALLMLAPPPTS